jgi:hypothetical protein
MPPTSSASPIRPPMLEPCCFVQKLWRFGGLPRLRFQCLVRLQCRVRRERAAQDFAHRLNAADPEC